MILDDVYEFLGRFIVFPSEHARAMLTLWIAHTHLIDAFDYTPRLCIYSAERRSGKSTLVKLTKTLCQRGYHFVNPSPPSIYTMIEARKPIIPTLCIDEQDKLWEKKETAEITMILDQGFEKDNDGVPRVRMEADNTRDIEMFNTFCPVMLAGIENDKMPETIADRCVIIRLKRRMKTEKAEKYRLRLKPQAKALGEKLAQWAVEVIDKARETIPEIPDTLDDRFADILEPVFIVSNVSDVPMWQERALNAALWFASEREEEEPSTGIQWLAKIKEAFETRDRIFKRDLETAIGIDRNELNQLRRRFVVKTEHTIRIGDKPGKGWYRFDWNDVFSRYLDTGDTQGTIDTLVTTDTKKEIEEMPKAYELIDRWIAEAEKEGKALTYEDVQRKRKEEGLSYNAEALDEIVA